jgi:hypothetical protein
MSIGNLFDGNGRVEIEPAELAPFFMKALMSAVGKLSAPSRGSPWTDADEAAYQDSISSLVAEATSRGVAAIKATKVTPDGLRTVYVFPIERVTRDRTLQ